MNINKDFHFIFSNTEVSDNFFHNFVPTVFSSECLSEDFLTTIVRPKSKVPLSPSCIRKDLGWKHIIIRVLNIYQDLTISPASLFPNNIYKVL